MPRATFDRFPMVLIIPWWKPALSPYIDVKAGELPEGGIRKPKLWNNSIFKYMVKVSCKLVQERQELLPKKPDNGQVEMFPIMFEDRRLRLMVFEYVFGDWILNVAEF